LEELDRQDRGQAAEDVEVIPFDDVSHRRGDEHGPEILWDFNSHIVLLRIARLYRFIASRHGDAPDAPQRNASSPFATVLELKLTVLQRPSLDPVPCGSERTKKVSLRGTRPN